MWWLDGMQLLAPPLETRAPIVGGEPLSSPSGPIVALVDALGAPMCTGTLVDEDSVLTAAHCLDHDPPPVSVAWGLDLTGAPPERLIAITAATLEPSGADVALLSLAEPAPDTPALLLSSAPAIGDVLVATGFGAVTDTGEGLGVLRSVEIDVIDVLPDTLYTFRPGANLCSGDSGAPLSLPRGDRFAIAGVASQVTPSCVGGGALSVRVDVLLPFLLEETDAVVVDPEPLDTGAPPRDTGRSAGETPAGDPPQARSCGCASAPPSDLLPWLLSAWLFVGWGGASPPSMRQSRRSRAPGSHQR